MLDWNSCVASGTTVATLACLPVVFINILNALFIFSGVIAVIMIIFSGYRFIFSGGDAKQVETAQKTFTYAIGGLVLVLLAFFILRIITFVTHTECLLNFGPLTPNSCAQ